VKDMAEGVDFVNRMAPEHLAIMTADPGATLGRIRNARARRSSAVSARRRGRLHRRNQPHAAQGAPPAFLVAAGRADLPQANQRGSYGIRSLEKDAPHVIRLAEREG